MSSSSDQTLSDLYAHCQHSCVRVATPTGQCGTGFFLSDPEPEDDGALEDGSNVAPPDPLIMTAAHLFEYPSNITEPVIASTPEVQTFQDVSFETGSGSTGAIGSWQYLDFTANVLNNYMLDSVSFKLGYVTAGGDVDVAVQLYESSIALHGSYANISPQGYMLVTDDLVKTSNTVTVSGSDSEYVPFTFDYTLDTSKYYYVKITKTSSGTDSFVTYYSSTGVDSTDQVGGLNGSYARLNHLTQISVATGSSDVTPTAVTLSSIVIHELATTNLALRIEVLRNYGDTLGSSVTISNLVITAYLGDTTESASINLANGSSTSMMYNMLTVAPAYPTEEWNDNTGSEDSLTSNPSIHSPGLSLLFTAFYATFSVAFDVLQDDVASSVRVATHVTSPLVQRNAVVHISNQNGTDRSAIHLARVVAMDGRNDMAMLRVLNWDGSYLDLASHRCMRLEDEEDRRAPRIGDQVHIVGDPLCSDYASLSSGVVRDHKHFSSSCDMLESLIVDASIATGNSGSMMVNNRARVVGLLTFSFRSADSNNDTKGHETFGGGPSLFMLREMVRQVVPRYRQAVAAIAESGGSDQPELILYRKPFVGLQLQLNSTKNWHSLPLDILNDMAGVQVTGVEGTFGSSLANMVAYSEIVFIRAVHYYDAGVWQQVEFGVAPHQQTLARVLYAADRLATLNDSTQQHEFRVNITYYTVVNNEWTRRVATNVLLYARDSSGDPLHPYPPLYDRSLFIGPQRVAVDEALFTSSVATTSSSSSELSTAQSHFAHMQQHTAHGGPGLVQAAGLVARPLDGRSLATWFDGAFHFI